MNEPVQIIPPSREQLLEALDSEVNSVTAARSAAGWNYWVILGAMAALLWLAIDRWEKYQFILSNVALLTLALSVTWDVIQRAFHTLDASPPVSVNSATVRFRPVSRLLACARSILVFHLLRYAALFYITIRILSPFLWPVLVYQGLASVAILSCLGISFGKLESPNTADNEPRQFAPLVKMFVAIANSVLDCSVYILTAVVLMLLWGEVWLHSTALTTHDFRLALLAVAFLYLLSLAVEGRSSTVRLTILQTLRQNLAFSRIPLSEAQTQVDLLLVGGTLSQILQPHYNALLAALEQVRSANALAEPVAATFAQLAKELAALSPSDPIFRLKQAEFAAVRKKVEPLLAQLESAHDAMQKKHKAFLGHYRYLVIWAPSSAEEGFHYLDSLEAAVNHIGGSLEKTRKELVELRTYARNPRFTTDIHGM